MRNFEGIAHVADAIVISRGNLGLDFEPEVGSTSVGLGGRPFVPFANLGLTLS